MTPTTPLQYFAAQAEQAPAALILLGREPADEEAAWLDLWTRDRVTQTDWTCVETVFLDGNPDPADVLAQLVAAGLDREMEPSTAFAPPYVHGWRSL
jgi:hypothetical protein